MGKLTSFADDAYPSTLTTAALAAPDFSLPAARFMAWTAQLAYETEEPEILDNLTRRWHWTGLHRITCDVDMGAVRRHARGYVAQVGKCCIMAFCGTEPDKISDFAIDFDVLRRGNDVSHGMNQALDRVWGDVVNRIGATTGDIFISGHSLGGAFAVLAAQRLAGMEGTIGQRLRGVYTYGMPRVGNTTFATTYNGMLDGRLGQCTYRLTHGTDLVAKVPMAGNGVLDFRHVGRHLASVPSDQFVGQPGSAEIEGTDGNLDATRQFLADAFTTWGDQLGTLVNLLSGKRPPRPFPARHDAVVSGIELLPQFFRDHLMDRYLRPLGVTFPGDKD